MEAPNSNHAPNIMDKFSHVSKLKNLVLYNTFQQHVPLRVDMCVCNVDMIIINTSHRI